MKKTTFWKIAASVVLVAVLLPLFSALNAPTPVSALTVVPPLPYAMEQYGQHHSGIYQLTESAPAMDGKLEEGAYTFVDTFFQESGNFNGIFVSDAQDGSKPYDLAAEYCPKEMTIYGTYDADYAYFHITTVTQTNDDGYQLTAKFGFDFASTTQKGAAEGFSSVYALAGGQDSVSDPAGAYHISTAFLKTVTDSAGTYDLNTTVFEFKLAWSEINPNGGSAGVNFDRMYTSFVLNFFDGYSTQYWVYGVPNSALFLESENLVVGEAFALNGEDTTAPFTPNVIELLGEKGKYTASPTVSVSRKSQNGNERTFDANLTVQDMDVKNIRQIGIIFAPDTSLLGGKHLVWIEGKENVISTTTPNDEGVASYTVSFTTAEANYNKFFSIRPFVIYEDNSLVYGQYYSNTPAYYDANFVEYTRYMNVLMIGCSFSNYYLDELVAMAKESGVYMTAVRSYKSAAMAYEHWNWLLDDYPRLTRRVVYPKADGSGITNELLEMDYTYKEILAFRDWDVISVQDHYGIETSHADGEGICMDYSMPYLPNIFRYLDVNYPEADLYLNETWAFQVGHGYSWTPSDATAEGDEWVNPWTSPYVDYTIENGRIVDSEITGGTTSKDDSLIMKNYTQQIQHYNNIKKTCYTVSESTGVPMIPCGDAWQIARYSDVIMDQLCNRGSRSDGYHDGEEGGGQYLNACVWYEMLVGDCRGNTWRPSYNLSEEKIEVLQNAAHQAVQEYKQTQSFTGATVNK